MNQGGQSSQDIAAAAEVFARLRARLRATVKGRDEVIDLLIIAMLADGHVLLEDFPGSGKTTLARALGESLQAEASASLPAFRRIQFTPDLLPSDITGTNIFELKTGAFSFRPGPIFSHVVLADEINRTSPKVQAAMLEAMAEKQVTIDNESHRLDDVFFVVATQNPLDLVGTYPLPSPQLDRFLFKIRMRHIDRAAELEVLDQYPKASLDYGKALSGVSRGELVSARAVIRTHVHIDSKIKHALVDLARDIREDARVLSGVSTRALVLSMPALQARAMSEGRSYVSPDDLLNLAPHIFSHRVECVAGGDEVVAEVISQATKRQIESLSEASLSGG